ncbi:DUF4172 domain-containing protein [Sphingomonas sp. NIC1]|uniref:DUF4172 domain-containing protein n=1 Tax=Sphingomonas sp. NIC1 TaxID=1961362 RepID=UPI0007C0D3D4|nr:DUF4172 domain-containing protein [Sphingomonas sp. NIC1]ANC85544.1 hypothetical protein A7E77_00705 [Sphingomonas sp. NIC1]
MRWNWQQDDWPNFVLDAAALRQAEDVFLHGSGVIVGILHHVDAEERQALAIELMSQEVVDSSAIEGEILDRASVQSSLAKQLGLATDRRKANAAEAGAAESDGYRPLPNPRGPDVDRVRAAACASRAFRSAAVCQRTGRDGAVHWLAQRDRS